MTLALAALVVALPVAAVAQDAGSNQYQDPLAGEPGSGGNGGGGGGGNGSGGGGGNAGTSGAGETQQVQSESGTGTEAAQADQLPATGVDAWLIAFTGVGLLALGVGLRLRVGPRPTA